eukprot:COSAG06_NODE_7873_length_2346_cov_1.939475_2_plen_169_part_00
MAVQLVCIIASGITGAVIGDQLHGSVSDASVVRIILVLLLMGSISMIVDLKGGSIGANLLVGCMACITIGGLILLIGRHIWLRCCTTANKGEDNGNGRGRGGGRRKRSSGSIPVGAQLCDTLLFGPLPPYMYAAPAPAPAPGSTSGQGQGQGQGQGMARDLSIMGGGE